MKQKVNLTKGLQMKKSKLVLSAIFLTSCTMAHATQPIYNDEAMSQQNIQDSYQTQNQSQSSSTGVETTIDSSVNFKQAKPAASSAYAPTVWASNPCMGSSSGGAQSSAFGVSFGSTWNDETCQLYKMASDFEAAGDKSNALWLRCQAKLAKDSPSCKAIAK